MKTHVRTLEHLHLEDTRPYIRDTTPFIRVDARLLPGDHGSVIHGAGFRATRPDELAHIMLPAPGVVRGS